MDASAYEKLKNEIDELYTSTLTPDYLKIIKIN
jgi:hypothetical protein